MTAPPHTMQLGDTLGDFTSADSSSDYLSRQINYLYRRLCETNKDLTVMQQEYESISQQYEEFVSLKTQLPPLQYQYQHNQQNYIIGTEICHQEDTVGKILDEKVAYVKELSLAFTRKMTDIMPLMTTVHSQVLFDDLMQWKREQRLQGNGAKLVRNLNKIQGWCEHLTEIIWSCRQQIGQVEVVLKKLGFSIPEACEALPYLQSQSNQLLSSLVTSTFVIEKQPQQVIKTNTRITSTVRLLVGGMLNIRENPPKVSVTIINEAQARSFLKDKKKFGGDNSGDIPDNTGVMEFDESTKSLSVHFKNLRLKKIRRTEKKGSETVWTLSLPVVVVVHGSQDPPAWGTVTWDNAFAIPGRLPFSVPEQTTWDQVEGAIKMKFMGVTGCSLSDENLKYLAEKLFGTPSTEYGRTMVSFSRLCKETLPQRTFTFWEWFYAVMKLTREHLRDLWHDGYILGFVRKKDAEDMLSSCPTGTFLLRFSDSELGGITIAWVGDKNEVLMLQPFTCKDFAVRSLPDRISDLSQLLYLYLHMPKDLAFGKYYTPFDGNPPVNGYVKPLLVTHVPGVSSFNSLNYSSSSQLESHSLNDSTQQESPSVACANTSVSSVMDC
ncbi:Signal transducer and transcription activator [Gryllus bimaculatus]|nr:Signal transducer and transcription activator [Gryllus bimaculatus]